ncbi:MAG: hypothetical protein HUJ53_10410, partial [Holdemanella sp.]|nr:hypothetical protein [Holdemanella sp.]
FHYLLYLDGNRGIGLSLLNGYDIADYQDIMDEFGTMDDFDELLAAAHERGIRIVMDLVVNHTSDEHKWFVESRSSKDNAKRDYYIWREAKDGNVPNNWGSCFSGSAWEWDETTQMYYLHCFSKKQPDLNWDNPKVRDEVFRMMTWWCDKGIDGFRMDVISMISKPAGLPDAPKAEGALYADCMFTCNGPHVHEYLQEMNKKVLSRYDIMTVGECAGVTIEEAKKTGAMSLFNEKYGDEVRVVSMGDVSKEFCAGCHVNNTNEIGICKIISEESIGSDSRRITAKTRLAAYNEIAHEHEMLENIANSARSKGIKNIDEKVDAAYDQMKALQKEIDNLKNQIFTLKSNEWVHEAIDMGSVHALIKKVDGMDAKALKDIVSNLKAQDEKIVVFFVSTSADKVVFVAGAGKDAIKQGANAGQLVKLAAQICAGNGGGKPDMAQAGGKDASKVDAALAQIKEKLQTL